MESSTTGEGPTRKPVNPPWAAWLLPVGFGALAAFLAFGPSPSEGGVPRADRPGVDRAHLLVKPLREAMSDPAHILVDGLPQNCNGCHQIFTSASPAGATLTYHQDMELSHGLNDRCINCHDPGNRERLTLRDGTTVAFAATPQLCAQCHGTTFRDWERGTHGKTLGSWVTGSEDQRRLSCNECHNPHSPKYEPFTPLPGPNSLRQGPQDPHGWIDHGTPGPLQRWLKRPGAHSEQDETRQGERP